MFRLSTMGVPRLGAAVAVFGLLAGLTGCTLPNWLGGASRATAIALPPDIPPPLVSMGNDSTTLATAPEAAPSELDAEQLSAAMEHAVALGLFPKETRVASLDTPITRGELAEWLKRFAPPPSVTQKTGAQTVEDDEPDTHTFADVLPGHEHFAAIEQAAQKGLLDRRNRSGETVFDPDTSVSRWVLCMALAKAQRSLETPSLTEPTPDTPPAPLPVDWTSVPNEARPMVQLALNNQVAATVFGLDDALLASQGLHPEAPVTKAQALVALYHYL